jgi:hydrogenase maturation protease
MRTVVLGIGNILMSDEGVGVRVVEELARRYDLPPEVEVIDGGCSGMEMLADLARADHVVIVDAVQADVPPASLVVLRGDEVPAFFTAKLSPHQVGLCDVLAALKLTDESPGSLTLIGVQPVSLDLAMELTPKVVAMLPSVVARVVHELEAWGVRPVQREAA